MAVNKTSEQRSRQARANILGRLRATPPPFEDAPPRPTDYLNVTAIPDIPLIDRFKAEVERLSGNVQIVPDGESAIDATLNILANTPGPRAVIAWEQLPIAGMREALALRSITVSVPRARQDDREAVLRAAEPAAAGITGADAAFATTGTLALITGAEQGRLPSLLPPVHIALLARERLYPRLEDWLHEAGRRALLESNSVVFITGPSRTSDIEMQTILGVHGPGKLHVVVYG